MGGKTLPRHPLLHEPVVIGRQALADRDGTGAQGTTQIADGGTKKVLRVGRFGALLGPSRRRDRHWDRLVGAQAERLGQDHHVPDDGLARIVEPDKGYGRYGQQEPRQDYEDDEDQPTKAHGGYLPTTIRRYTLASTPVSSPDRNAGNRDPP